MNCGTIQLIRSIYRYRSNFPYIVHVFEMDMIPLKSVLISHFLNTFCRCLMRFGRKWLLFDLNPVTVHPSFTNSDDFSTSQLLLKFHNFIMWPTQIFLFKFSTCIIIVMIFPQIYEKKIVENSAKKSDLIKKNSPFCDFI